MSGFWLVTVLGAFLFSRLPGSFLPEEDQGYALSIVQLPPGATMQRTNAVMDQLSAIISKDPAVDGVMQITGFSFVGSGENVGMAFVRLKDWSKRDVTAEQFIQHTNRSVQQIGRESCRERVCQYG